jgi:hypothetical protein
MIVHATTRSRARQNTLTSKALNSKGDFSIGAKKAGLLYEATYWGSRDDPDSHGK